MSLNDRLASPEMTVFFKFLVQTLRHPINSSPNELTLFEKYLLFDAYDFFRRSVSFPEPITDITLTEVIILLEGYKSFMNDEATNINSPVFDKLIQQMDQGLDGGVFNV
ncbi:hypothetical protein LCGC14_2492680 [marine sediment metagenome]|uniref:Uncharacterized protein n=1 Tax=marine sediment metagenome TaxID=412755 RepID=A0A0F9B521_9ZZZZ